MSNVVSIRGHFRQISSVLHLRDTALTGYLIKVLEEQKIPVSMEIESKLYEATDRFQTTEAGKHFLREALQSEQKNRRPSPKNYTFSAIIYAYQSQLK
ncbi:MAG TPA: hypothetical protein PKX87_04580 [Alphaproteobacteria bacterium]|nr:hypothetical protein [Alphaproteobacteria bacterium]